VSQHRVRLDLLAAGGRVEMPSVGAPCALAVILHYRCYPVMTFATRFIPSRPSPTHAFTEAV